MHWLNEAGDCTCEECGPLPGSNKKLTQDEIERIAEEQYDQEKDDMMDKRNGTE